MSETDDEVENVNEVVHFDVDMDYDDDMYGRRDPEHLASFELPSLQEDYELNNYFLDANNGISRMGNMMATFGPLQDVEDFAEMEYNNTITTNYDRNLTSEHTYLGIGLRETNSRTIFEEGIIHQIPVIYLSTNLIPKQIFPLIASSGPLKKLLKHVMSRNFVFGVSYKTYGTMLTFGTVAEIYAHSLDIETSTKIHIKAMGHQRYKTIKIEPFLDIDDDFIKMAHIRIMSDITLPNPFNKLCLHPRNRLSNHNNKLCRSKDMWQTQWPEWVYKQFDIHQLASRIKARVKLIFNKIQLTEDPYLLSLMVTKLGFFSPDQVFHLLSMESTNLRLKQELMFWDENDKEKLTRQKFMCSSENCNTCICDMSSVFPMSPDGPQGTYCNSWGQIHDMITVYRLRPGLNVIEVGQPSDECCWFPGYKWIIILCPRCQNHLGWRYIVNEGSTLRPRQFYGLSMASITSARAYIPNTEDVQSMDFIDYMLP